MRGYISAINDLTIDESQRLQQELIELKESGDQIQKLRKEKDTEIQDIKQKYEEINSTLQNILTIISNSEQPVDSVCPVSVSGAARLPRIYIEVSW